jgi:hypothetical protein
MLNKKTYNINNELLILKFVIDTISGFEIERITTKKPSTFVDGLSMMKLLVLDFKSFSIRFC